MMSRFLSRTLLASSLTLALALTSGCSARGAAESDDSAAVEADVPPVVVDAALSLQLGAQLSSEGAAGSSYYDFEKATVRFSNVMGKIDSVKYHDTSLDESSRDVVLEGDVLKAAIQLGTGAFKHTDGAMGSSYYEFGRATIRYGEAEKTLYSVTFDDEMLGELSGDVLTAALSLELGRYKSNEGAAGSFYYSFDRGTIRFSNTMEQIEAVTVAETELPMTVVSTSIEQQLGRFIGEEGAAGHLYFEFELGTVDYDNVGQRVLGVQKKQ
jgi:hypothetical protein